MVFNDSPPSAGVFESNPIQGAPSVQFHLFLFNDMLIITHISKSGTRDFCACGTLKLIDCQAVGQSGLRVTLCEVIDFMWDPSLPDDAVYSTLEEVAKVGITLKITVC